MKSTDLLLIVGIVSVCLALANVVVTVNKIGDFKELTGRAQSTDWVAANLTIESNTEINFSYLKNISWGSGYVSPGDPNCELTTTNINNCTNFVNINRSFVIVNIGNEDVHLNLTSNKDAAAFIGGTAVFQWNVSNNVSGSCHNYGSVYTTNISVWTDVETDNDNRACDNFSWDPSGGGVDDGELNIDLRVVIPSSGIVKEAKEVIITAIGDTYGT